MRVYVLAACVSALVVCFAHVSRRVCVSFLNIYNILSHELAVCVFLHFGVCVGVCCVWVRASFLRIFNTV